MFDSYSSVLGFKKRPKCGRKETKVEEVEETKVEEVEETKVREDQTWEEIKDLENGAV